MSALTYLFCAPPAEELLVEQTSSSPAFSIGHVPVSTLSRRQRIAEAKKKKQAKRRALRKKTPLQLTLVPPPARFAFDFTAKRWMLSDRGVPTGTISFLMNAGKTFPEIYMHIMAKKRRQQNHFLRYNCYMSTEPAISLLNNYLQVANKNQGLIRRFRCLAHRWMRSKLTVKNTEDLVTGEVPVIPVRLVDWRTRSIYVFEARTMTRDIVTRLTMSHCDFFPWPKLPRNPYTNEQLTEAQFYSVARQLRAAGETHWAIEALYSAKYKLAEFERDMYSKLKRTIHNSVFANPCGDVAKRILLEYIEEEHKEHKMLFEAEIYEWAVEHLAHHFSLHKWRVECTKYYSIIHFPGEKEKDDKEKERIDAATRRLCAFPAPLVQKYNAVHEKKYVKLEDRAAVATSSLQYEWVVGTVHVIDVNAILATLQADAASTDSDDSASETG